MKQHEFEARVLALWTTTRVPLTRANLLADTRVPRAQIDPWLGELVRDGLLEVDSDDEGELLWKVRGAKRPARGPESLAETGTLARLSGEVDRLATGASVSLAARAVGLSVKGDGGGKPGAERKSMLASGALSFFLGPFGWLYAAPLKEALPAIFIYMLLLGVLPKFIMIYLLGPVLPVCAIAGVLYAWSYNREGRRMPLLLKDPPARLPPGRRR